jgi:hypothetical protein
MQPALAKSRFPFSTLPAVLGADGFSAEFCALMQGHAAISINATATEFKRAKEFLLATA